MMAEPKHDILLLCASASRLLQCYDPALNTRHPIAHYIKAELWKRKHAPPPDSPSRTRQRVDLRARGTNPCL